MSERATRLCEMSPTIATTRPSSEPSDWRSVNASSSAWVGCSWQPSPAFTTGTRTRSASMCGTPATESRTTSTSALMAARLRAMSASVSAFDRLEPARVTLIASAESRFAAISNETRVRVDDSRNTLITVRPRSVGTRLISRCEISSIASDVSSTRSISSRLMCSMPSRCLIRSPPRARRPHACAARRVRRARSGCSCPRSRP